MLFNKKALSITIALLLTIPALLTNHQSHAMLRSASHIKPAHALSTGMRNLSSAVTQHQVNASNNRRAWIAAAVPVIGAIYFKKKWEKEDLAALRLRNKNKYEKFMETTIKAGLNPNNFASLEGKTPLMAACEFGDLESVKMLLENGGNL